MKLRVLAILVLVVVFGCGKTEAPREAPPASAASIIVDEPPPSMPLAQFLGTWRAGIESLVGTRRGSADTGWVEYSDAWALRYEAGCAVALRARRPVAMDCAQAVGVLGYGESSSPLRRADRCEWPGTSDKHRLGPHLRGSYDAKTGIVEVERVDGVAACARPVSKAATEPKELDAGFALPPVDDRCSVVKDCTVVDFNVDGPQACCASCGSTAVTKTWAASAAILCRHAPRTGCGALACPQGPMKPACTSGRCVAGW